MNEDITMVSNALVYNGDLCCGNSRVRNRRLKIPHLIKEAVHNRSKLRSASHWLAGTLEPNASVVFLNIDTSSDKVLEFKRGATRGVRNDTEAKVISLIVCALVSSGVLQKDIGIISPYRAQLRLLRSLIKQHAPEVEV